MALIVLMSLTSQKVSKMICPQLDCNIFCVYTVLSFCIVSKLCHNFFLKNMYTKIEDHSFPFNFSVILVKSKSRTRYQSIFFSIYSYNSYLKRVIKINKDIVINYQLEVVLLASDVTYH